MRLKILLPTHTLFEGEVSKVSGEAENGSFTLLPRHIGFATALVPGILSFEAGGEEVFVAVDEGILVKCGPEVLVSTRNAIRGDDLGRLEENVRAHFFELDERERRARSALVRMEADFVRRYLEMQERE